MLFTLLRHGNIKFRIYDVGKKTPLRHVYKCTKWKSNASQHRNMQQYANEDPNWLNRFIIQMKMGWSLLCISIQTRRLCYRCLVWFGHFEEAPHTDNKTLDVTDINEHLIEEILKNVMPWIDWIDIQKCFSKEQFKLQSVNFASISPR